MNRQKLTSNWDLEQLINNDTELLSHPSFMTSIATDQL